MAKRTTTALASRMPTAEAHAVLAYARANKLTASEALRQLTAKGMRAGENPKLSPEQVDIVHAACTAYGTGDTAAGAELARQLFRALEIPEDIWPAELADDAEPPAMSAREAAHRNGGV